MKRTLIAALIAGSLTHPVLAQDVALDTEEAKVSYALGLMIGERVLKQYDTIDYDVLVQAMKAQHKGESTQMTVQEAQQALQQQEARQAEARAAAAKQAGDSFLTDNAARSEVTVTDSGLQYEVLQAGDGPKPTADDTVTVHYVGTLIDGREFDSSVARGEPASFPLKGVIPGWTEGVQLMNVGSKFRFVIPSDLAYGDRGAGQMIGPGETLVFDVELLSIKE